MPLRGNLRDFSTTQLLNLVNLAKKTGTLTIEGPNEVANMCFRDGRLVYAQVGTEESTLPVVLRRVGKLNDQQAQSLKQRPESANDKALGLLLINAGYVTQADIINSVRQYTLDTTFRLFTWVEGLFNFDANGLPPNGRIIVPIELDNVIIEGSRRQREWEHLQEELPNLDMALRFLDKPERLKGLNLSVEEWKVVSYIDPKNSIKQIAKTNGMTDVEIRKIVYGLLQAGLVELVRPDGMKQPVQSTPRKPLTAEAKEKEKSLVNKLISRIKTL